MKNTAQELQSIVTQYVSRLQKFSETEFSEKLHENKWSKKEVLGHLVDSAHNNLRRFICSQYEAAPPHIIYDQNFWVIINDYQSMNKDEVIILWKLMNERICAVCNSTAENNYQASSDTGRAGEELHSIEWLAEDYVKHLKHHLNHIFPKEFNIVYN